MVSKTPERPRRRGLAVHSPHPSRMANSRLHGFSLPDLSWGSQRMLRCVRIHEPSPSQIGPFRSAGWPDRAEIGHRCPVRRKAKEVEEEEEYLKVLRAKLMVHYGDAVDKIEKAVSRDEKEASAAARPWNLRTRRAACNAPAENGGRRNLIAAERSGSSSSERKTFSLELTKEEIEEDFLGMFGEKPSKRPKKRPRKIQNHLDMLFPGMSLPEISADTYKVSEVRKMKRGGLQE